MQQATHILYNGIILTMNAHNSIAEAVAFADDRILAVGDNAALLKMAGPETQRTDLAGATVLPGFYDAHGHFVLNAEGLHRREFLNSPPMGGCRSVSDCLAALKKRATATPSTDWVLGQGYDDSLIAEKIFLTRKELDSVSTEHPIMVSHSCGHLGMLNSRALELVGIDRNTPNPAGGVIRHTTDGEPNGVLEETALYPVMSMIPSLSLNEYVNALEAGTRHYAAKGVTTAVDAALYQTSALDSLRVAATTNRLAVRVLFNPYGEVCEAGDALDFAHPMIARGGTKMLADGSIQGFTGYLSQPYHSPFDGNADWRGYPSHSREKLFELVEGYHKRGQLLIHTNGDAAIDDVLDAIDKALARHPRQDHRHMLIHAQTIREDQLDHAARLGVTLSFFTPHIYYWGDRHNGIFLGPERASRLDPMRSALNRGMTVSSHADSPVTPIDPLLSIWICVNRLTSSGMLLGPDQRISVAEALRAHTINPAWQNFEDHCKGSLEPGKFADVVVLNTNPLTCPPESLRDIEILSTWVGGRVVYEK